MDDRRRPKPAERMILALALVASWCATGCLGPTAIRSTRLRYNEVMRETNDEQLLLNLVRLRYADSTVFIDLPAITSQFELAGTGNYNGGYGNQYPGLASLGFGELSLRDTPTLSYHPRLGREFSKSMLNPLSADLFSVVNAGARVDQLFWMVLNDINDIPNAERATLLVPRTPDDNVAFRRGIEILELVDDAGGLELGFASVEDAADVSDPIPEDQVRGGDLVSAAKDGYVFRARPDGRMTAHRRHRQLTMKIRSPFRDSPEMREFAAIFGVTPGLARYKVKSEMEPGAEASPLVALPEDDTIYLNLRSVLQIMTFLSKGVCVPEEHVLDGQAPMTPGPDGRPFDWTRVTAGQFFVASSKQRPKDAEVAVRYRGHWFFIPRRDMNSRSVLSILEILLSLQESEDRGAGPVLTLPAGG